MLRRILSVTLAAVLIAAIPTRVGNAQTSPDKKPADDPFAEGPPPAKPAPAKRAAPTEEAADPFAEGPPSAKPAPAKRAAPPVKDQKPVRIGAAESKPAAKVRPAVDARRPLRSGETAILKALEEKTTLEFADTPFQDVIDALQARHGIVIKLDSAALKDAGFDPAVLITYSISGVPLRSALRLILSDLKLEWTIRCDVLFITTPEKAESDALMVTKVYDVSDLIAVTQDRPYGGNGLPTVGASEPATPAVGYWGSGPIRGMGGMGGPTGSAVSGTGGMGGGMFAVPPETKAPDSSLSRSKLSPMVISCIPVVGAAEPKGTGAPNASPLPPRVDAQTMPSCCGMVGVGMASSSVSRNEYGMTALTDMIIQIVSTKSWAENGGTGTMSPKGNFLCITQTFQIQCEIKAFFAQLRAKQRAAPTVVVELQGLWLDAAQYEQLLGDGAEPSSDGRVRLAVDVNAFDALSRKAPGFRGRIVCANGQLVHLASGDRRSIIVNTIPVMDGGVGYSPVVQVPNVGVVVEVRPTIAPGGTTAVMDIQSLVTRWGKPQPTVRIGSSISGVAAGDVLPRKKIAPAGSGSCPVERPSLPTQQLAATVRVPLGRPVVLGGMTFAPVDSAGLDKPTDNPLQLYLIATTSIAKGSP
jgi:hypothetical protein